MRTFKINSYGKELELTPKFFTYDVEDFMGKELKIPGINLVEVTKEGDIPFATITKLFGKFIGIKNTAYIDTNNCPLAYAFLQAGIASDTGFTKHSGYCEYPLWCFDEDFLEEIGGEEYGEYSETFDRYMNGDTDNGFIQTI